MGVGAWILGIAAMGFAGAAALGQSAAPAGQTTVIHAHATPEMAQAEAALAAHRWSEAEKLLLAEMAARPNQPSALYLLAYTLFREDRPADSLRQYTAAAALRRPTALELRYVALDYVLLKDYDDADKWITLAASEDPKIGETWYDRGRIKYTENRFQEAIDSFRRALELMPRSVKVENNLGLALEGLNQPEQAMAAYRQAIAWQAGEAKPNEQPLLNLGTLLADRNQAKEALPLLLQAEQLAPKDGKIHAALGKLYARQGDLPRAQADLEQAVAAQPDDAGLHFQLGQVYRKEGLEGRAHEELARAAAMNGTHSSDKP